VLREKAMSLRAGGDLDGAYRGRVTFNPGLGVRTTAAAMQRAADVADAVGRTLGRLRADVAADAANGVDTVDWLPYTTAVIDGVRAARAHGAAVLVVAQPYASDAHVAQQRALAAAVNQSFHGDSHVGYVNLGSMLNIRDRQVAYDGLHLTAAANAFVAETLSEPVLRLLQ